MTRARMNRTARMLEHAKEYGCGVCGQSFASRDAMQAHNPGCREWHREVARRAKAEWDAMPDYRFPAVDAHEHYKSLSPERRAELNLEAD